MSIKSVLEKHLIKYWRHHLGMVDYGCSSCKEEVRELHQAILAEFEKSVSEEQIKKLLRDYVVMGMPDTIKIWTRHIEPLAKQLSAEIKSKLREGER